MRKALLILCLMLSLTTMVQAQQNTLGNDFWVMFLYNGGDHTPNQTNLSAVGDSNALITIANPATGWSTTANLTANQSTQITVPLASSTSSQSNTPQTKNLALHITSTSSISLYANNYREMCGDISLVYPSHSLGTHYIMQDYMGDAAHTSVAGAEVGFVATLDNTILTMVLPCNLLDNSAHTGDTLTINLMSGESYQLIATAPGSFSGMEVTSNDKPFAAFQGNRVAYIPTGAAGADLIYEQTIPVNYWDNDYVVASTYSRNADRVRITSSENNCQVYANGTLICTLQKGETHEDILSSVGAKHYTSTEKICIGRYLCSNSSGGYPGDPSSVMIPPADQGIQRIRFSAFNASDYTTHYINIVAHNSYVTGITLDGNNISSQFTMIDTTYSFAQIPVSPAVHLLESTLGPVVADLYGLGNYASYACNLGRSFIEQQSIEQSPCSMASSKGTDFWVAFFYNYHSTPSYNPGQLNLTMACDEGALVNIAGPGTNTNVTIPAGSAVKETVGYNNLIVATPYDGGYHITSNNDIWLYACNYIRGSQGVATIIPTSKLDTTYIVQDYPAWVLGAQVVFVATEDSTVLTMTVPCNIQNTSITTGTTLTPTLMQGQCYLLISDGDLTTFSGMRVTSNGKPFAMFQGGRQVKVPSSSSGSDLIFEQALPTTNWGTEFIVTGASAQTGYNYIRITSSEDNCDVYVDGTHITSLNATQTYEYSMPSTDAHRITSSHPVCVILYLTSYGNAGNLGDPSTVTIPSIDHGICSSVFKTEHTSEINDNNHYINIVCHQNYDDSLLLDGTTLPTSGITTLDGYRVHRIQIPINSSNNGIHSLTNSQGPFVAYVYGVGYYESYAFPLGFRFDTSPEPELDSNTCQAAKGRDFWVGYIMNGGEQRPEAVKIIAMGDTACTVTVENSQGVGWSQTVNLAAGSSVSITLPDDIAIPDTYNAHLHTAFHVTSTADINLTTLYTQLASSGATTILPTSALGNRYIVLDYPADPSRAVGTGTNPTRTSGTGATVTIVATKPNTNVYYTPSCQLYGSSIAADTPVTHYLDSAGQTVTLMTNNPSASLSGMEITSDKPIAVFQGNQITSVPFGSPSGDFMYEQSWPVKMWGHTYALIPTQGRTVGDRVRVVADTACTITLSTGTSYTLADHEVKEIDLPANQPRILTSTKPVSVAICSKGSDYNAEPGDASQLMVPPMERGICQGCFATFQTERIHTWYVAVTTDAPSGMTLDGSSIASQFLPIGTTGYSYACIQVTSGYHTIDNSNGLFTAWTYGIGNVESYYYNIGLRLDPAEPPAPPTHDTVDYRDTVCQNHPYNGYGFTVGSNMTINIGTFESWRIDTVGDTVRHHHLILTILPMSNGDTMAYIIQGDTLFFQGDTLTQVGTYPYVLTAANGCDSLLILYLNWEAVGLSSSATGLCPGDSATLTANGLNYAYWTATPPDPSLDALQGLTTITVSPQQTTTYSLSCYEGGAVMSSVTIGVEPPPTLCLEISRPFIDFDYPVIVFTDCSEGNASSLWSFSDGIVIDNGTARRQFHHPLPDSVEVTLQSCNRWGCCSDTSFFVPKLIRSIWFPNVFTPDQETNNRFGATVSFDVTEFSLHIYNRWGMLIYQTDDINATWDGTRDGQPMPQGAYVYYWHVRDAIDFIHSGTGSVTLLR